MRPEQDGTALSDLLRRTPGPLCILDTQTGRMTASNDAFAALLGLDVTQVTGLSLSDLVAPADRLVADYVLAGLASGLIDWCQGRARLTVPNAGVVDVVVWARPMQTERPRSQVVLLAAQAGEASSNAAPWPFFPEPETTQSALCVVDQNGQLAEASVDVDEVLGWDPDHRGTSLQEAVHPDDAPLLVLAMARSVAERRTVTVSLRRHGRNGRSIPIRCEVSPLRDHNPPRYAVVIRSHRADAEPTDEKASRLEGHLWRIALELHAAGIGRRELGDAWSWTDPALAGLSQRQAEILRRIVRRERVPAIARDLFISQSTVRNHLAAIYRRLDVHSQAELLARLMPPYT
jgi:PAS domain S-box-containing protein